MTATFWDKGSRNYDDHVKKHDCIYRKSIANTKSSAIIAFNIFHLVDNATNVLARLNDLLAAGGLLISQTPCLGERSWAVQLLIDFAQRLGLAPSIRSFTIPELESLVSSGNFDGFFD